jgi:putative transposase
MPGVEIERMGFDNDHVHFLMNIPPKYSIAEVIGEQKARSASNMRKTFKWLDKVYWKENVVWSPGYFVSSVGLDEPTIRNYVEHQGRKDSGQLRMEL